MNIVNAHLYLPDHGFVRGSLHVKHDRIEAVSSGEAESGDIDLGGGFVLPGLVDTHFHLTSLALKTLRCDLSKSDSAETLLATLAAYAAEHDGPHVVGVEWDEADWQNPAWPTRADLDAIDRKRPVLARRICGHVGVVNSVLLDLVEGADPDLVDRDRGVLREDALWQAGSLVTPADEAVSNGIQNAIAKLHALGVTAVHDIVEPTRFKAYFEGVQMSKLPLRIDALVHAPPSEFDRFAAMCEGADDRYFRLAGVKTFLDGSLGGETAALHEPYGRLQGRGTLLLTPRELDTFVYGAYDRGCMCAMHAIGDRAIDQALDAIESFPPGVPNFRIEHCEFVGPKQLERLTERRPILAMQPNFVRRWAERGGLYEERLGGERVQSMNPLRSLRDAGLDLIFGTDGMPPGPLFALKGATGHPVRNQRLTAAEAIDGFTRAAHAAGLHRREAGEIRAGYLADLTVLDRNPLETDSDALRVTHTVVGGRVVYEAGDVA